MKFQLFQVEQWPDERSVAAYVGLVVAAHAKDVRSLSGLLPFLRP